MHDFIKVMPDFVRVIQKFFQNLLLDKLGKLLELEDPLERKKIFGNQHQCLSCEVAMTNMNHRR